MTRVLIPATQACLTPAEMGAFADALREELTRQGIRGQDLAALLGQETGSQVSRWTNARTLPQFQTVEAIERALGINDRRLVRARNAEAEAGRQHTGRAKPTPQGATRDQELLQQILDELRDLNRHFRQRND